MKKLAVVHYMPLEFYPPVTNFLNIVGSRKNLKVKVSSTENNKKRKRYTNEHIAGIKRVPLPEPQDNSLKRLYRYLRFNFVCFFSLVKFNPDEILYYESYSAGPVYWYLKLFGKKKRLYIHYHEYFSPEWYEEGMRLVKIYHKYERQYLYGKADWISQTNQERIEMFLKDHPEVDANNMRVLPNFPPKSWLKVTPASKVIQTPLQTVYVGSLSLKSTYIKEYCEWVMNQEGAVNFDIYAYNLHQDTEEYLMNLQSPYINFIKGGVEYEKMPLVLQSYDVGLILYKAFSKNYEFNAPNKLFEYMVCGLEIWFSDKMKGCYPYKRTDYPRIIPIDFNNLHTQELLSRKSDETSHVSFSEYTADKALEPLVNKLQQ